ncbi:MAG: DUF4390 domain-containing protein [Gallionellaceae bacterium]
MTKDKNFSAKPFRLDSLVRPGLDTCRRQILAVLCFVFSVLCLLSVARADGIEVRKAEARFSGGSYQLSADFKIRFNPVIEQALEEGIPLYFDSEFTLTHPRWYWFDDVVAQNEQVIKLSYSILTRQYRIARGALFQNFTSLDEALSIIEHQTAAPIPAELVRGSGSYISEKLFKKSDHYVASVRLRLDVSQLPKPLQVNALASDDWNFDSDWYRWIVYPDTAEQN